MGKFLQKLIMNWQTQGKIKLEFDEWKPITVLSLGLNDYYGYRIPAIISLPDDRICIFAEARKDSLSDFGNIDMVMVKSLDGGDTWESPEIIMSFGGLAVQNPAPIYDPETNILHLYTLVDRKDMYHIYSKDFGKTWSEPELIKIEGVPYDGPDKWYLAGPSPGHGVIIKNGPHKGRFVIAGMYSKDKETKAVDLWGAFLMYSDDKGKTWKLGQDFGTIANESLSETLKDGRVFTILRPNRRKYKGGKVVTRKLYSFSDTGGETSDPPKEHPDLITPVCQSGLLSLIDQSTKEDSILLYSGPNHPTKRIKMTIKVSKDGGLNFKREVPIYNGTASYSDMAVLNDNHIGLVFEGSPKHVLTSIIFVKIPIKQIIG